MFSEQMRKLIIVTDDKNEKYAELLLALISMKEDKKDDESKIIDPIEGVIWKEKNYIDSKPSLGSDNKIVFVGKMKSSEPVMSNIGFNNEFAKYGVYYGSIANKAVIYVDDKKVSSNNLYDEFLKSYTEFINKVGNSYDNSQKIQRLYTVEDAKQPRISNTKKILNKVKNVFNKKDKENTVSDGTADVVSKVTISLAVPFYWPVELFSIKKSKSEIRDQQFRCSVLMFYLNWLSKFME